MTHVVMTILGILLVAAIVQVVFSVVFVQLFYRWKRPNVPDEQLPRAAILLSLRGADPYLVSGLRCLLSQDYPDYELHVVVDHREDPAWDAVEQVTAELGTASVHIAPLRTPSDTCSLKCSSLLQLLEGVDESVEVLVQADADLVSHSGWLRDLISPLVAGEGIGATFGNRWFMPRSGHWGSVVRYIWNAAAVIPMYVNSIPWGGTFAIRASVLKKAGLAEKWSKAVVEDAPVRTALQQEQLKLKFVPTLMMVNREDCGLAFALDFIKRQLTWTRLYHPRWGLLVWHAAIGTLLLFAAVAMIPCCLMVGRQDLAVWMTAGLAAYGVVLLALVAMLELGVRHVVRARGESVGPLLHPMLLKILPGILLTQVVHAIATAMAVFRRRVAWRGVTYHIRGPWDVQMLDYRPFETPDRAEDSNLSL